MASVDLDGSRSELAALTETTGNAPQRARPCGRPALEIGTTFSVLLLIAVSALALRFLVSLPTGLMH
jgi:hypothetical protein